MGVKELMSLAGGLGLFLLAAPHLASWIIGKAADLLYRVLGFITA